MALPVCSKKIFRLQFSLTSCLSAENIFCLRCIISQFSCLALQKYSLIIGFLAITSSNIMSFFISFGSSSGWGGSSSLCLVGEPRNSSLLRATDGICW